ncbi:hypothetical protein A4E84_25785 [Streptomyces qaidamensis]|uniref:Uncharacterized protein n=1 Tax=Streptomyces qaidamensis TaxID=1783515 RepID=A0A143C572_9ACTN|nr:hypothetical protein [Streptomyces qaidamensis]AMW12594.1 hypothetical protein A4E84_25785 [Streptomyces qaidamensis]
MTLVRCWAVGIVVPVLTEYVRMTLIHDPSAGPDGVGSFGAAPALVHLPNPVCAVPATWAAARVHPQPWRQTPVRHPTAACAAPAAAQVLLPAVRPDVLDLAGAAFWMSTGVPPAGCAMGLLLDRLVWTS